MEYPIACSGDATVGFVRRENTTHTTIEIVVDVDRFSTRLAVEGG